MLRLSPSLAPCLAVAALCACAPALPHPWSHDDVCSAKAGGSIDAGTWLRLILHDYRPEVGRINLDCSGVEIAWEGPAHQCVDPESARRALPDRPIAERDVVVSEVDRAHRLVWVQTRHFADGDALGPIALVKVRGRRLRVEALGTLRAYPSSRLRLVQGGGAVVLVAEGKACPGAGSTGCGRAARLMTLNGTRFSPSRMVDEGGACLGAGWVQLAREVVERVGEGKERHYRLDASVSGGADGIRLTELVTVHDRDPRRPAASEKLFRRAEAMGVYRVRGGDLVAESGPLWSRVGVPGGL